MSWYDRDSFDVTLSLASIGAMLARLHLTPQKPLQRAYQRDPEAIERWQRDTYPNIARRAREQKADIFFWDESGFRADSVHGRTWAPRGETPVVERPGERHSMGAASAVNSKGAFWFATYEGVFRDGFIKAVEIAEECSSRSSNNRV
ncbi:Mobile element protein [Candidatus Paraburkholderia kirkii]|nr:Mobile element protein [Candidatus Paraburkholderia kirkii]